MFRKSAFICCVAGVALVPVSAFADELDVLQFNAGLALQHDSNVFRLSDQASNPGLTSGSGRSDTVIPRRRV